MKISTILDHIDNGHMALPEFQRGYVWNRDQVRGLFDSLYKRHPVGGLLVWVTESNTANYRGDGKLAQGVVKLLLDGQQRITSIYGVVRGKPPEFFDGNSSVFSGLFFHLEEEVFQFYQPIKMKDDPLWIDVSKLMINGQNGLSYLLDRFAQNSEMFNSVGKYASKISHILGILDIDLHTEEVTGKEKNLDVVVDIFNRVNSGGTKLSKGDLALAKICSDWPEGRNEMKNKLKDWEASGYNFNLDWLLRSVNTLLTGEAKFLYLHEKSSEEVQNALEKATRYVDSILNLIAGRFGLDHDQVFFGKFAVPVMVRYLEHRKNISKDTMSAKEQDKLLFWYVQAAMWGRFSGSVESTIDKDLEAIKTGGLDMLLEQLRLWHGGLKAEAGHFTGWSLGARFYPVLYLMTRLGDSKDWGNGLPLKSHLLGKMNRLEVHHIFPKSQLYKMNYRRPEVNALANYCFLTKETNLIISDRLPEEYFPEIEEAHPGVLASQWIPNDPKLWKIENFRDFLEERKQLLATELNRQMEKLLHGESKWLSGTPEPMVKEISYGGGFSSEEEEILLQKLNYWVEELGLPRGELAFDYTDESNGKQYAVFDLAWPKGLQENLSQPVAVLLNEEAELIAFASQCGYKVFTEVKKFKKYVEREILSNAQ